MDGENNWFCIFEADLGCMGTYMIYIESALTFVGVLFCSEDTSSVRLCLTPSRCGSCLPLGIIQSKITLDVLI